MTTGKRSATLCSVIALAAAPMSHAQTSAPTDPLANVDRSPAQVLGVYVFGKKSQTAATQLEDERSCFTSAKTASGYDQAMADAAAPAGPVQRPSGGRVRGAVGGAVTGTVIGAVAGDAGKGAAIGATAGTLSGGARQRQARAAQAAQAAREPEQKRAAALAEMKRAFGACMESRDYSVK
jgi:hypothetical protein